MAFIPIYHTTTLFSSHTGTFGARRRMDVLTASQNNYDLSLSTSVEPNGETPYVFDLYASTAVNITGIVAPGAASARAYFLNVLSGSATITLVNASGSSTAANQMNATSGGNVALAAGDYAVLNYDAGVTKWTIGQAVPQNSFKLEVPGATEGVIVGLDNAWWSAHNTGFYDATGTKTANAVDVFYRYGVTVPTATYASSTAAERESSPIEANRDELIQVKSGFPFIYFLASVAPHVTVRFRKNEQGNGLNRQGA